CRLPGRRRPRPLPRGSRRRAGAVPRGGEALVSAHLVPLGQQPAAVRRVRDAAVRGLLRRDGGRVRDRAGGGLRGGEIGARWACSGEPRATRGAPGRAGYNAVGAGASWLSRGRCRGEPATMWEAQGRAGYHVSGAAPSRLPCGRRRAEPATTWTAPRRAE